MAQLEKRVHSKESNTKVDTIIPEGISLLLTSFGDEATSDKTILKLNSKVDEESSTLTLIVPGLEAMAGEVWHEFAADLNSPTYILQLGNATDAISLDAIFESVSRVINDFFVNFNRNLNFFFFFQGRSRAFLQQKNLQTYWLLIWQYVND